MIPLLYQIPAELMKRFATGEVQLFGAILKETTTGLIVGHVQQTGLMEPALRGVLGLASSASSAVAPLQAANILTTAITGGVSIYQNHRIGQKIAEVQSTLALMQNLQVAGLLVSGMGIGVSVAGFAVMNARLKTIGKSLDALDAKVQSITRDRRDDELAAILQRIEVHLDTVDGLETRRKGFGAADRASEQLRVEGGALLGALDREVARAAPESETVPDIDRILGVAATIRIVHEASTRALFLIDEVEEAGRQARVHGKRLMEHTAALSPDALARVKVLHTEPPEAAIRARREALPRARIVTQELRQSALIIASQESLTQTLKQRGIPGRALLAAISGAQEAPLMMLPVAGRPDELQSGQ